VKLDDVAAGRCAACGKIREGHELESVTYDTSPIGHPPGTVISTVRFCADSPQCKEATTHLVGESRRR
jgi:hypothetical protein